MTTLQEILKKIATPFAIEAEKIQPNTPAEKDFKNRWRAARKALSYAEQTQIDRFLVKATITKGFSLATYKLMAPAYRDYIRTKAFVVLIPFSGVNLPGDSGYWYPEAGLVLKALNGHRENAPENIREEIKNLEMFVAKQGIFDPLAKKKKEEERKKGVEASMDEFIRAVKGGSPSSADTPEVDDDEDDNLESHIAEMKSQIDAKTAKVREILAGDEPVNFDVIVGLRKEVDGLKADLSTLEQQLEDRKVTEESVETPGADRVAELNTQIASKTAEIKDALTKEDVNLDAVMKMRGELDAFKADLKMLEDAKLTTETPAPAVVIVSEVSPREQLAKLEAAYSASKKMRTAASDADNEDDFKLADTEMKRLKPLMDELRQRIRESETVNPEPEAVTAPVQTPAVVATVTIPAPATVEAVPSTKKTYAERLIALDKRMGHDQPREGLLTVAQKADAGDPNSVVAIEAHFDRNKNK